MRPTIAALVAVGLLLGTHVGSAGAVWSPAAATGMYVVELEGEPLAGYGGGLPGLPATSPDATGATRLDTASPASTRYLAHLARQQDAALSRVRSALGRSPEVRFRYHYAVNGLALRLSPDEARRVASLPGVLRVEAQRIDRVTTDAGPRFIGGGGIWDGTAVPGIPGTYGEGIVVGVIDTGIAMRHRSFAAEDERGYRHANPRGHYYGMCDPNSELYDARFTCNDKLIGVYSFLDVPSNANNPEDDNGHGTHTASTTAGNFITVRYNAPTASLDGVFSGVAPHANIIAYDACYTTQGGLGSCPSEATLAALDQALADQVDVLNYSIETGQGSPWTDTHYRAFRRLQAAGTFSAVSAGNAGPNPATANAVAPWTFSIAAVTHDRFFTNGLVGMTGGEGEPPADMVGGGLTAAYGPKAIVYAKGEKNVDGEVDEGGCLKAFPANTWHGEIVVCDRGTVARLDKGRNVLAGGAGGMVLANAASDGDQLNADPHALPAIQIGYAAGRALKGWLEKGTGHTASITAASFAPRGDNADVMAAFSSRGPAVAAQCCRRPSLDLSEPALYPLVKPDVAAPGMDIIAAVPGGGSGVAAMSGTSMAAPHVAGAGALLRAVQPEWTVAEMQSALMTTARLDGVRREDGRMIASPADVGSGRLDVGRAAAAGLLLDVRDADYAAASPSNGGDVRDLNVASMADVRCLDRCRWTRTVESPLVRDLAWTVEVSAPSGMPVTVTPSSFTLVAGGTREITIEADASAMGRDAWAYANLQLVPSDASVPTAHMPIAVHTVAADIPAYVQAETREGTGSTVAPGLRLADDADLTAVVHGLTRGRLQVLSLEEDKTPTDRLDVERGGAELLSLTVPDDSERVIVQVVASEAKDVDLFLGYDANNDRKPQANEIVDMSASESWNELAEVYLTRPQSGRFWVVVQNFDGSDAQPDDISVVTAVVPEDDEGNLEARVPAHVTGGQPFELELDWSIGAPRPGDRWYGVVDLDSRPGAGGDVARIAVDLIVPPLPTPTPTGPTPTVEASNTPTATSTPSATGTPTATDAGPTATEPTAGTPRPTAPLDIAIFLPYGSRGIRIRPDLPTSTPEPETPTTEPGTGEPETPAPDTPTPELPTSEAATATAEAPTAVP